MQNDDITWSIINRSFCASKVTTQAQNFCRDPNNVTGLCSRSSCPLSNSQYATVREENGICYLYVRTAERFYFPAKQWEKVKLSKNFKTALRQIDVNLILFKKYFRQKCRQRLLKITQYLTRMRKLELNPEKKLIPIRRKIDLRIKRREEKALVAARTDFAIEKKLLQRLKDGVYGKIYNFPSTAFSEITKDAEQEEEIERYGVEGEEREEDKSQIKKEVLSVMEKDIQQEEEEESEEREYVADLEESDDEEEMEDIEDMDIEREYVRHVLKNDLRNDDVRDAGSGDDYDDDESVTSPSSKKRKLDVNTSKDKLKNISKVKKLLKKPKVRIEYEEEMNEEEEDDEEPVHRHKLKVKA